MASTPSTPSKVICPLERPPATPGKSVFFAGTTSKGDWRKDLAESISHLPVTVFNPFRPDWDSTWKEDISDARFKGQVEWELEMQERADIIVVYFEPDTEAHISLLELGLCARSGKAIVACSELYKKRGNVQAVCARYGIPLVDNFEGLQEKLVSKLGESGIESS
ncbi:hypothetical protein ColTof4_00196 [Colletotrichum tofieldiae]|uniref:Nucleoside 2-deoxyribosyltransferase domain-containing protein n=1 Tax=Colletotrichum tofieldiae TaxID=708197 RepID=A0A166STF6_9PEZI|nr:hypothetical protein CT0861_08446 [Colletotrichum tofieldiae]GKT60055.1 hypothetical protein ColTof3_07394 [Colletotrichum tofieldiae]GKT67773.1 hypothetical protein ColTof4_00196 [Colletotrichum tofieldiae]GKT91267.1 hypothetical protein Ct61P_09117 [Colletotrichum tofieldiae]